MARTRRVVRRAPQSNNGVRNRPLLFPIPEGSKRESCRHSRGDGLTLPKAEPTNTPWSFCPREGRAIFGNHGQFRSKVPSRGAGACPTARLSFHDRNVYFESLPGPRAARASRIPQLQERASVANRGGPARRPGRRGRARGRAPRARDRRTRRLPSEAHVLMPRGRPARVEGHRLA
jgi:hypothetical protein